MDNDRLLKLLRKWSQDQASVQEERELLELVHDPAHTQAVADAFARLWAATPSDRRRPFPEDRRFADAISSYQPTIQPDAEVVDQEAVQRPEDTIILHPARRVRFLRKWSWAAASILLVVVTTIVIAVSSDWQSIRSDKRTAQSMDIFPGREGAILTLADGTEVVLDSLGNGVIATQNGTQVLLQNNQLTYTPSGSGSGDIVHNTMSTPKGRQFSLRLPDGTQVWLNAASSIRFPALFTGRERQVEVSGEVYFEVAGNPNMPFTVNIRNQGKIDVLGTTFNVNAYDNEAIIQTTLISGSVRVSAGSLPLVPQPSADLDRPLSSAVPPVVLKPGQQAQITTFKRGGALADRKAQPGIIVINNADIDKVMAWKNGQFNFEGAGLPEVMNQLERWYNIEVIYEQGIPDIRFFGKMTRKVELAVVLKALKDFGVHFRIEEGRKLIVLP